MSAVGAGATGSFTFGLKDTYSCGLVGLLPGCGTSKPTRLPRPLARTGRVKAEESSASQDWYLKKVREYRDARRTVLNAARDLGVTEEV